MAVTEVTIYPNAYVTPPVGGPATQFQCSVMAPAGTRVSAPNINNTAWPSDGLTNTYLDLAWDGTIQWAYGALLMEMANPTLASGVAIGYIRPTIPNITYDSSSETIIRVLLSGSSNQDTIYWIQPYQSPLAVTMGSVARGQGFDFRNDVNNLRVQFEGYRGAGATTYVSQIGGFGVILGTYPRPTLTVTGPGASVTTTARPTINWTFSGDFPQSAYKVRIFTAAQFNAVGFNPQTSTATVDSDWVDSTNTYYVPPTSLTNGTQYRAYVMAGQSLSLSGYRHETVDGIALSTLGNTQYSQFTLSLAAPPIPTAIKPVAGSTQTTDRPTLGATLGASSVSGTTVKAEWQLARDAGFTTSVRSLIQADTESVTSGVVTKVCDASAELFQGTWYIRCREVDSNGVAGSWSASQTFTVAHTPTALATSPSGQSSRQNGNVTFSFGFSDSSPYDYLTAFQILVERNSDGFPIYDSGKQPISATSHTTNISSTYNDVLLRWRVRVYDSDDVVSAYSANSQFYVRALPTITAVLPTASQVLDNPSPTYSFTSNRTISQYRFLTKYTSSGVTHDDSNWKTGSVASYVPAIPLVNSSAYTVTMQVRDLYNLENSVSVNFTTTWNAPANPTITVSQTNYDSSTGALSVSWNQNRDSAFISYKLYYKKTTDSVYTLLNSTTVSTGSTYTLTSSAIPANTPVHIAVTQTAYRFGIPVESIPSPTTLTLTSTHYYLISDSTTLRLSSVNSDSFSEEWEQEEIQLIGRGRRVERGTRFGVKGSLQAKVYDVTGLTAAQQRIALEDMRAGSVTCKLRTPFGDIWEVAMGDIQINRIAGVGTNEYFEVTIPYSEVSD